METVKGASEVAESHRYPLEIDLRRHYGDEWQTDRPGRDSSPILR